MFVHEQVSVRQNGLGNATYKLVCETRQGILKSGQHSWELRCRPVSVLDPTFMPKNFPLLAADV